MASHYVKPAAQYGKLDLDELIKRLKDDDPDAVYECVVFTLAESFGIWHNRARAKICRNLKHRLTDPTLRHRLVDVINHGRPRDPNLSGNIIQCFIFGIS